MQTPERLLTGAGGRYPAEQIAAAPLREPVRPGLIALDAEREVLGAAMADEQACAYVAAEMRAEFFEGRHHRQLFEAIERLFAEGQPVNPMTILDTDPSIGSGVVTDIYAGLSSTSNAEFYSVVVRQKWIERQTLSLLRGASSEVGQSDIFDLIDSLTYRLSALSSGTSSQTHIKYAVEEAIARLHEWKAGRVTDRTPTGIYSLDAATEGYPVGELTTFAAQTGAGKCLAPGTPVLMFDGTTRRVEDVRTGELVMGPDSTPRRVLGTTRGVDEMYRITPTKGDPYTVNAPHILSLRASAPVNGYAAGEIVNVSVTEYLKQGRSFKRLMKGWRSSVEFDSRPVPLDPYILGVWLGDGTSTKTDITTPEPEILRALHLFAESQGLRLSGFYPAGTAVTVGVNGTQGKNNPFRTVLRELDVFDNKHVPHLYLANDRKTRLELLAGLIDTDGSLTRGGYDFCTKHRHMSESVAFLCRSLGLAAYVSVKTVEPYGDYYRVSISGDCTIIPCRVPRKKAPERLINKDVTNVGIRVDHVGEGEYCGFELDGDGLFLLGDFTVTHNTSFLVQSAVGIARREARTEKPRTVLVFSCEMGREQLAARAGSNASEVNLRHLRGGTSSDADADRYENTLIELAQLPIHIDDAPNPTLTQIAGRCQYVASQGNGLAAVFVDYDEKVHTEGQSEELRVSAIAQGLKAIAKRFGVPVVALSQYGRQQNMHSRPPEDSFLRYSGKKEQESALILHWIWPKYWLNRGKSPESIYGYDKLGDARGWVRATKNRNGPTGQAELIFDERYTRFIDPKDPETPLHVRAAIRQRNADQAPF